MATSGLSIQRVIQDDSFLPAAREEWEKSNIGQIHLSFFIIKEAFDKEIKMFESKLVKLLDNHAKVTQITIK